MGLPDVRKNIFMAHQPRIYIDLVTTVLKLCNKDPGDLIIKLNCKNPNFVKDKTFLRIQNFVLTSQITYANIVLRSIL